MAEGRFRKAHETFEDLSRSAGPQAERDLWQGFAQVAAALARHDRGEAATAISLLAKARARLLGSRLTAGSLPALKGYLDALAEASASERDLPPTGLPEEVLAALRRTLQSAPARAVRPGPS